MRKFKGGIDMPKYIFNLQLFAEGGAGGEGGAGAPGAGEASNGVGSQQPTVIYGKQEQAAETQPGEVGVGNPGEQPGEEEGAEQQKQATLKELLKSNPSYKQEVEQLIQNRVKNATSQKAQLEAELNAHNEIMLSLYARYGLQEGDKQGLQMALARDNSYLQEEADLKGIDVQQLAYIKQMEFENMKIKMQQKQSQEQQYIQQQQQKWNMESQACKEQYPDFDFIEEMGNQDFVQLIRSGYPVKEAYEFAHRNEMLQSKIQQTAETVKQQVTSSIKSKQSRPQENAATNLRPGMVVKSNPNEFDKKDLQEIRKRVARGEKISF